MEIDDETLRRLLEMVGVDPDAPATDPPRNPKPDPSQGRGANTAPPDYRTASKEDFNAELRRLGVHPRH